MAKNVEDEIIKSTRYCNLLKQASLKYENYTYCIDKIFAKSMKRNEMRVSSYKDIVRGDDIYVTRSLDITELELMELIKKSIKEKVFSYDFIDMLKKELK